MYIYIRIIHVYTYIRIYAYVCVQVSTCKYTYCVHVYTYMPTMYMHKYIRTAADLRDFGALTEGRVLFDKIAIYLHVSAKKEKNSENSVL